MFGALTPLPLRLGGAATDGWTAAQHARVAADCVAALRTHPLAQFIYTKSGATVTVLTYRGRNGVGSAYAPDIVTVNGTGDVTFGWSASRWADPYDSARTLTPTLRAARARAQGVADVAVAQVTADAVRVAVFSGFSGGGDDGTVAVTLWGEWLGSAERTVGDYGGDPDKHDSTTEGRVPYAATIYRELQEQRGSVYATGAATLVDAENLALARWWAAVGPRNAEKLRANATPKRSDERLPYWQKFLAIPTKPGEPKWRTRQKLAAHYQAAEGPDLDSVRTALQALLGDIFVDCTWEQGATLSVPPTPTFWPVVNPGPAAASLGGGAWLSARCHLFVEVQIPAGMSEGEFLTIMQTDFHALLDRMLPGWATFDWAFGGGFLVASDEADTDAGLVGFTGL